MTDPGTALGAVSLGIQVAQGLIKYYSAYRSYSKDVERTVTSVENFLRSLEQIEGLIKAEPTDKKGQNAVAFKEQLEKNVRTSRGAFETLRDEWKKVEPDPGKSGARANIKKHGTRMLYPFRKESLVALQSAVADARSNLEIGISTSQLHKVGLIESTVHETAEHIAYIKNKQELDDIKRWLGAPDHTAKHSAARARHHPGTGEWFIHGTDFQRWLSSAQVLWLTGIPGCGKTVLCSKIIDETRKSIADDSGKEMAYYYFSYNDPLNGTVEKLARSLISQFSFPESYCAPELEELYEICTKLKDIPTLPQLIEVLEKVIMSFEDAYIILDALNEAPEYNGLWKMFSSFSDATRTKIHVLLVGQNYVQVDLEVDSVQIDPDTVNNDIRSYIKEELKTNRILLRFRELQDMIEKSLMQKAGGMFQLVTNQLDRLKNCQTKQELVDALNTLPGNLDDTWQRCFDNISGKYSVDRAVKLLTWLCFSRIPMRVDEIIDALAMPNDWTDIFDLVSNRLVDPHLIFEIGSGLVESDQQSDDEEVVNKAQLRLAHSSVKEWLLSENMSKKNFPNSSPFAEASAHALLAKTCILYLMQFRVGDVDMNRKEDLSALAAFAASSWRYHVRHSNYSPEIVHWVCRLLTDRQVVRNWLIVLENGRGRIPSHLDKDQGTALLYAAEEGLEPVVEQLLKEADTDINEKCITWMNPLQSAARFGHIGTVKLLLNAGAEVDDHGRNGDSALLLACEGSDTAVVEILLKAGAAPNYVSKQRRRHALSLAAGREDDVTVRLLIDHHAEINRLDRYQRTALHEAALSLKLENIRVLLAYNANKTLQDADGNLALHLAIESERCSIDIVKALYFDGAESVTNLAGELPLYSALYGKNEPVCQLLIDASSNVKIAHPTGSQYLLNASRQGTLSVVKFLHEKGADFVSGNVAAIHNATLGQHVSVIEYLLQHGQDIDFPDSKGATAFLLAVRNGHERMWSFLVEKGANIHALNNSQENACTHAVLRNQVTALRWLLDRGVRIDQPDSLGRVPLHHAARYNNLEVLKCLVEKGADIHALSNDQANACHWAAGNGKLEALQFLIDQGVDALHVAKDGSNPYHDAINSGSLKCTEYLVNRFPGLKDLPQGNGCKPLTLAAGGGHIAIVDWMIQNGMDINEQFDVEGNGPFLHSWFALLEAATANQQAMVKFLLDKGANPNLRSGHQSSPLLEASEHQGVAMVQLLVEKGADYEEAVDLDGDNCLICSVTNPSIDVLKWFTERSTAYDFINKYGCSPMLRAALGQKVDRIKILHEAGFVSDKPTSSDTDATEREELRNTSIWYARRALKTTNDRLGIHGLYSPLMAAAHRGHVESVQYLYDEVIEMRNYEDKNGNDALTYACCAGHLDVAKLLCRKGLDPKRTNKAGRTVTDETEKYQECINQDRESGRDDDGEINETQRKELDDLQSKISEILPLLRSGHILEDTVDDSETLRPSSSAASMSTTLLDVPVSSSIAESGVVAADSLQLDAVVQRDEVESQNSESAPKAELALQETVDQNTGRESESETNQDTRELRDLQRKLETMRTGRRVNTF